jgi:hypothetical protein
MLPKLQALSLKMGEMVSRGQLHRALNDYLDHAEANGGCGDPGRLFRFLALCAQDYGIDFALDPEAYSKVDKVPSERAGDFRLYQILFPR